MWRAELAGFSCDVAVIGDTVLAGGWRGYPPVCAFDLTTGAPRQALPSPPARQAQPARVAAGRLLVLTKGTVLVAEFLTVAA